jgi:flagella basal body P-ring formation protein FlgA
MWWLFFAFAWAEDPVVCLQRAIAEKLSISQEDVEIRSLGIASPPADATWTVELPAGNLWGTISVRMTALEPDENQLHYTTYARVSVWDEVPVAAEAVQAGQPIVLTMQRVRLEDLRGATPVDPARSWLARSSLQAGQPVTTLKAKAVPDALEGTQVRIVVQQGALRIETTGMLLEDAWAGQLVHVKSQGTAVELVGIYESNGLVRIGGS